MSEKNFLSLDSSILYRCNQKYYDKALSAYGIGYTQLILLTQINEHEGISMNELAANGSFDKGTITKSIQKLESNQYVRIENSLDDKRSKLLFTTEKSRKILPNLYLLKQEWWNYLSQDLNEDEIDLYFKISELLNKRAREYADANLNDSNNVRFYGFQKLTLLDYPGKVASTLFTGGCNFRCPFCHNRDLVFLNEKESDIENESIFEFLKKRKGVLDGICISGGEPLMHSGLKDFLKEVKAMGFSVKLDTNGSYFERLKELVEEGLIDYVAMDIKNSKAKYTTTIGLDNISLKSIEKSVKYLLEDHIDYEFRTTVVKEFHQIEDFKKIGQWIKGAKRYYLQNFEDHDGVITKGLHSHDIEDLKEMKKVMEQYVLNVEIRGVEE